jgi:hypothetical protein
MTHSPEPWRIVPREPSGAAPIILDANGEIVELEPHNEDWTIANWPRIVACVNALRNWTDEDLEGRTFLKSDTLTEDGKVVGMLFQTERVVRPPTKWENP